MLLLLVVLMRPLLHTSIKGWLLINTCCSIPNTSSVFAKLLHAHYSRNLPHAVAVHHVCKLKLLAASPLLSTAPAAVRHSLLLLPVLPLLVPRRAASNTLLLNHTTNTVTSCCCCLCCASFGGDTSIARPSSSSGRWGG
jgi:hypothetical protein